MEIIHLSLDANEAESILNYSTMPWLAIDYSDRATVQKFKDQFAVHGTPKLVMIDESGRMITTEGVGIVLDLSLDKIRSYDEDRWMATLPDTLVHMCHEHPLSKVGDAYGEGGYYCDECAGLGGMWAYHCAECGFDVHPACVVSR